MHKRRRRTETVALTIAILASPNATTKGGGPHVLLFLFMPFPSSRSPKRKGFITAILIVVPCHFT